MNSVALNGTERLSAGRPGARQSAEMPSLARAALRASIAIGASFVIALTAVTLRMLATAHMVSGFHDALAGRIPFLG